MAIEPVDGPVAGDARFKCLKSVEGGSGFLVVTANSGGVVSLIDLEGAARMILSDDEEGGRATGGGGSSDEDDDVSDEDEEEDVAAEFLESVRIGSGARITNLAVWSAGSAEDGVGHDDYDMLETGDDARYEEQGAEDDDSSAHEEEEEEEDESIEEAPAKKKKQKIELTSRISGEKSREIELDAEALEKARSIIKRAKKKQKKAKKKKSKNKD